jgi:hypothetical protein
MPAPACHGRVRPSRMSNSQRRRPGQSARVWYPPIGARRRAKRGAGVGSEAVAVAAEQARRGTLLLLAQELASLEFLSDRKYLPAAIVRVASWLVLAGHGALSED